MLELGFFLSAMKLPIMTCTGVAAINTPATSPPKTLPSDPANDTLNPPVLVRLFSFSKTEKEPDMEMISNRPSYETVPLEKVD